MNAQRFLAAAPLASGVFAALAVGFKPALSGELVALARAKPARCLAWGAAASAGASVAGALFLGAALRAPDASSSLLAATISMTLFCLLLALGIVAAAVAIPAVGASLRLDFTQRPYFCVGAGYAVLTLARDLPVVGPYLQFAALSWGAGALILKLRKENA